MYRIKSSFHRYTFLIAAASIALSAAPFAYAQNNNSMNKKMKQAEQEEVMDAIDEVEAVNKKEALEHALEQGEGKKLGIINQLNNISDSKTDFETDITEAFQSDQIVTEAELQGETSTEAEINNAITTDVEDAGLSDLVRTDAQEDSNLLVTTVTKPAQGSDNTVVNINDNPLIGFEVEDEKAAALGINPDTNIREKNSVLLTTPAAESILDDAVHIPSSLSVDAINMDDDKIILISDDAPLSRDENQRCAALNSIPQLSDTDINGCGSVTP